MIRAKATSAKTTICAVAKVATAGKRLKIHRQPQVESSACQ
jgi:hypothetical protein